LKRYIHIIRRLYFRLLWKFQQLQIDMKSALSKVLYCDAVDEWISCNLNERIEKLTQTVEDAKAQVIRGATPKYYPDGFPMNP